MVVPRLLSLSQTALLGKRPLLCHRGTSARSPNKRAFLAKGLRSYRVCDDVGYTFENTPAIPSVLSDGLRTVAGQVRQVVPAIGIAYSCLLAREEEVR